MPPVRPLSGDSTEPSAPFRADAAAATVPAMEPDLEVSRDIAAPPSAVFAALTDVTRMGEWSPETHTAAWKDGHDAAALGAEFEGHNRNGEFEWTTEAVIVDLVPDERFFFDCKVGDYVFASWGYVIEPTDGGCRVTECWQDLRTDDVKALGSAISGVDDRPSHNRAGMERTLEALAAAVE